MKKTINHGLIGAGGFGLQHLQTLLQLEKSRHMRLAAICDPNIYRNDQIQEQIRSCGIRLYQSCNEMLEGEPDLTSVTIAAPIPYHYELALKCLERDLFIYLEKPPVPLIEQLDHLIAMDVKNRILVGFHMIGFDWNRQLKQWLMEKAFGDVLEIRACACWPRPDSYYSRAPWAGRMTLGGEPVFDGPATNALAHLVHNIMYLAADEFDALDEPIEVRGELYRARPIESYDTASLSGRFASGTDFFAAFSHASGKLVPAEIHIVGTRGWARVCEEGNRLESNLGTLHCVDSIQDGIAKVYRSLFDYIQGRPGRPATFLRDARGYTLATNAMLLSSKKIHPINKEWVHRTDVEDGIFCVPAIPEVIERSLHHPRHFSQANLPWGVAGTLISTSELDEFHSIRSLLGAALPVQEVIA